MLAKLSFQFSLLIRDLAPAAALPPTPFASPMLYKAVSITLPSESIGERMPADCRLRAAVAS